MELMLIVVILGIVAGIGIPTFQQQVLRAELKAAREDIVSTLRLAQTSAASERVVYRVEFNSGGNNGYRIGKDPDGDGVFDYETLKLLSKKISFVTSYSTFDFLPDRTISMPFSDVIITNGKGSVRFYVSGGTGYHIKVE